MGFDLERISVWKGSRSEGFLHEKADDLREKVQHLGKDTLSKDWSTREFQPMQLEISFFSKT